MASNKDLYKGFDVKLVAKCCSRCRQDKPLNDFSKNKKEKDGLSCYCRECWRKITAERSEKRKAYYERNKEEILKKQREYGKVHRDEIRERRKDYLRKYVREHRKERNAYNKQWQKKNKEKIKERRYKEGVRYRAKHKDEIRERKQAYENKRRKCDPMFRLKGQVRIMVRDSFRRKGLKKSDSTEKILGCSLPVFQEHLLQTWEKRYGVEWNGEDCHIDHIIPLATAETEEDIIRLCHYTNLQLLTPADNFEKGGAI